MTVTQTASRHSAPLRVHEMVFSSLLMTLSANSNGDFSQRRWERAPCVRAVEYQWSAPPCAPEPGPVGWSSRFRQFVLESEGLEHRRVCSRMRSEMRSCGINWIAAICS